MGRPPTARFTDGASTLVIVRRRRLEMAIARKTICNNHQQCVYDIIIILFKHNKMAWNILRLLQLVMMMGFFTTAHNHPQLRIRLSYISRYVWFMFRGMVVLLIKFLFDLTRQRDHHYVICTFIHAQPEVYKKCLLGWLVVVRWW